MNPVPFRCYLRRLRIADMGEAIDVVDGLFAEFCRVRGASTWSRTALPALRAWLAGLR